MGHDTHRSGSSFGQLWRRILHWNNNDVPHSHHPSTAYRTRSRTSVDPRASKSTVVTPSIESPSSISCVTPASHRSDLASPDSHPVDSRSVFSGVSGMSLDSELRANPPAVAFNVESSSISHRKLMPTDVASVMTIASSSKRRRRSIDTNASTRPLVAESIFSRTESIFSHADSLEPEV